MKSCLILPVALAALVLVSCAQNRANGRGSAYASRPASKTGSHSSDVSAGRALFLKNCAHCHGSDAHGDEGPDLHNLDWTDEQIATRIRNGKKGQMTAFAEKLSASQISDVVTYLHTLK